MESTYYKRKTKFSRSTLVLGIYSCMALIGLLISGLRGDHSLFSEPTQINRLAGLPIGIAVGLMLVALSRFLTWKFEWARKMNNHFRELLGALSTHEVFVLALASSIGEECLFRGALQPWIGLVPQAFIFGLLHIGPSRDLLPWTFLSLLVGLLFGLLFAYTGTLWAPIIAHFIVNFLNLRFIALRDQGTGAFHATFLR